MPCEKFENLLTGYSDLSDSERGPVDAHLAGCSGCREFFEALAQLDENLKVLYSGLEPHRAFNPASVRQPSALPEILDFCGWAAVVAILAVLSVAVGGRFGLTLALPPYVGWYAAGAVGMVVLLSLLSRGRGERLSVWPQQQNMRDHRQ